MNTHLTFHNFHFLKGLFNLMTCCKFYNALVLNTIFLCLLPFSVQAKENALDVYFIFGQSNACGSASYNENLKLSSSDQLYIWNSATLDIEPLVFGENHFLGGNNDETEFGPESGLAVMVNKKSIIAKVCHGATSLRDRWNPNNGDLSRRAVATIKNVLDYLNRNNIKYEVKGLLWMQGESDATKEIPTADVYYKNSLSSLFKLFRDVYNFPIVIAEIKIGPSKRWFFPHQDLVNNQFFEISQHMENVIIIKTSNLSQDDDLHFDNTENGIIKLGAEFFNAVSRY